MDNVRAQLVGLLHPVILGNSLKYTIFPKQLSIMLPGQSKLCGSCNFNLENKINQIAISLIHQLYNIKRYNISYPML